MAAPRGDFTLGAGADPVLLISAGIGVTPVLSMLHQLAAARSQRDIWWLYGARGPREHPFASEAHALLASLPHAREYVFYSAATLPERRRAHAAPGRLTKEELPAWGVPPGASAYICGPGIVYGRHAGRPDRDAPRPGRDPHGAVRGTGLH